MARSPALLALLITLALPSVAEARMDVGFQSEGAIVEGLGIGRQAALDMVQSANGRWVRILVQEQDWQHRQNEYVQTVADIKARGLNVMVTLMRWRGIWGTERPGVTPAEWEAFLQSAVPRLAPHVDAWGTTNEPNHPAFAAATPTACVRSHSKTTLYMSTVRSGRWVLTSYRKVSRGRGKWSRRNVWTKVAKKGTHRKRGNRYVKVAKGGRYVQQLRFVKVRRGEYVKTLRRIPVTSPPRTVTVSTEFDRLACEQMTRGVAYRPIHDMTAWYVRHHDPGATVILGDLCPALASTAFMEAVFESVPGRVDADVFGVHPYSWQDEPPELVKDSAVYYLSNIEWTVKQARSWYRAGRMTGNRTWVTEWGVGPSTPAWHWSHGLARMEAAGVGLAVLYELTQPPNPANPWDTGLHDRAGTPRPAWDAVKGWIGS